MSTHTYSVSQAVYNASYPPATNSNPAVVVLGTVDGGQTVSALVWWAQIQQANAAGGAAEVQKVLGPALLLAAIGVGQLPNEKIPEIPTHTIVTIPAPSTGQNSNFPGITTATCNEALNAGSWTA